MGSVSLSVGTAAWLALQVPYQWVINAELDVLCREHHLTFACMRHWLSRLL